nr:hypothetical protein [Salmonid herpesvirus 1]
MDSDSSFHVRDIYPSLKAFLGITEETDLFPVVLILLICVIIYTAVALSIGCIYSCRCFCCKKKERAPLVPKPIVRRGTPFIHCLCSSVKPTEPVRVMQGS